MPLSGAAPFAGTRAARDESLTAVPGRIHGVAVWRKCDTLGSSRRKRGRSVDRTSGAWICITNLASG